MNFSMIFSAVDKATKVMEKIMATEKKMARAMKSSASKGQLATQKTQRANGLLARSMGKIASSATRAHRVAVIAIRKTSRATKKLHQQTLALGKRGFGQLGAGSKKLARGVTVATGLMIAGYGGAALAAGKLVGTASQFEKFQTILETTEGSSAKAETAMKWVQDFAVKTPYELDQVTDSFVKLRAYGLDPTNGLLKTLGDTSAAMGKPLMQAVEAVADAVTGENERLKEFGIKASKTGNLITYAYTNAAGKSVEVAVKASNRMGIQQKLMSIMNEKFAGSMGRLSATWSGMMSNLADQWMKFQLMIMKSGLFDWMKGKLKTVLDTINAMEVDGSLQKWASQIGTSIQSALEQAWAFATKAYEVIKTLSGHLSSAAAYVGGWENLAMILGAIAFGPTLIATAAGIVQIAMGLSMLGAALIANPIGLVIAAIAAGAYLIYSNWGAISGWFSNLWSNIAASASNAWTKIKSLFDWVPSFDSWNFPDLDFGSIETAWESLKAIFTWSPSFDTWSLPKLDIGSIVEVWNRIKSLFDWSPDFGGWSFPSLDFGPLKSSWESLKTLFAWSPIGIIVNNFGKIASTVGRLIGKAVDVAGSAWSRLKSVFSSQSAVDIGVRDPASIERATQAATQLKTALGAVQSVDLSGVSGQINRLKSEASGIKAAVASSVSAAQSYLAGQSFHQHGVRLMDTMAAGMRARAQVVVAQIRTTMQEVRNHLPSSPAKVGPLSDIHRLKFGETIAGSIRSAPMVKAMRVAAAATMAAATPISHSMAVASTVTPLAAARSTLPTPTQSRAVSSSNARNSSAVSGNAKNGGAPISVTYGDIIIQGGGPVEQAKFKEMLREHRRDIKRLVDGEDAREQRKEF